MVEFVVAERLRSFVANGAPQDDNLVEIWLECECQVQNQM